MTGGSAPAWNWISMVAVYFVVWWITLFAILPFSFRAQDEQEVVLGTHSSAPKKPRFLYVILWTTVWSLIVFGGYYVLTAGLGFGFDDLPQILPQYNR